jgi:hypothetical protein
MEGGEMTRRLCPGLAVLKCLRGGRKDQSRCSECKNIVGKGVVCGRRYRTLCVGVVVSRQSI